jgi:hypothetical protein
MATKTSSEFVDWIGKQFKAGYRPVKPDDWATQIDSCHDEIRKLIGGITNTFEVTMPICQKPLSYSDVQKHYYDIHYNIMPKYFQEYGLSYTALYEPTLPFNGGIKVSKHMLTYAKRQGLDPAKIEQLNKILTALGELWSRCSTKEGKYYITISTDPKAFMMVGSFGCDGGSCFSNVSFNADKPYSFGICKNTFVCVIRTEEPKDPISDKAIARFMGHYLPEKKLINFHNEYGTYGGKISPGNLENAIKAVVEDVFETEKLEIVRDKISVSGCGLYGHNPNWAFSTQTIDVKDLKFVAPKAWGKENVIK